MSNGSIEGGRDGFYKTYANEAYTDNETCKLLVN